MAPQDGLVPTEVPHWHFLNEKVTARFRWGKEKIDVRSWTSFRVGDQATARAMMRDDLARDLKDHRYAVDVKGDDHSSVYCLWVGPVRDMSKDRTFVERHFRSIAECFNPTCEDRETNVRSDGMSLDPKKRPKPDMKPLRSH